MDTRRHVSITQPTSVATLVLLGGHVRSQGNRDSTKPPQYEARAKSTLRCSGRRIDTSPPKGCCEESLSIPAIPFGIAYRITHLADS
jgi:hypothetical protein